MITIYIIAALIIVSAGEDSPNYAFDDSLSNLTNSSVLSSNGKVPSVQPKLPKAPNHISRIFFTLPKSTLADS
jgi:hypothetical protein